MHTVCESHEYAYAHIVRNINAQMWTDNGNAPTSHTPDTYRSHSTHNLTLSSARKSRGEKLSANLKGDLYSASTMEGLWYHTAFVVCTDILYLLSGNPMEKTNMSNICDICLL